MIFTIRNVKFQSINRCYDLILAVISQISKLQGPAGFYGCTIKALSRTSKHGNKMCTCFAKKENTFFFVCT